MSDAAVRSATMQWRNPLISIGLALSLLFGLSAFVAPMSSQEAPPAGDAAAEQHDPAPVVAAEAALQDEEPCFRLETLVPAPVPLPAPEPVGLAQDTVQDAVGPLPVSVALPCDPLPEQVRALVDESEETLRLVLDVLICEHDDACITVWELLERIVDRAQAEVNEVPDEAERHLPEGSRPIQTPMSSRPQTVPEAVAAAPQAPAEVTDEPPVADAPVDPPADVPSASPSVDPAPVPKRAEAAPRPESDPVGSLLS